jgi:hypothetical protein
MPYIPTLKKITAIVLIALMSTAVLSACTDNSDDVQTTTTATPDGETIIAYKPDETARILPNLPDMDWGEQTFRILTADMGTHEHAIIWTVRDIAAEELTGESINDAVWHRNAALLEKYNFIVEEVRVIDPRGGMSPLQRAVAAGDDYFDAITMIVLAAATVAEDGLLTDLHSLYYIDFEQPWWDRQAVTELTIGGKLFFASGDATLVTKDSLPVILFNEKLLADLHLDCPYELVYSGQWTLGALYDMARSAGADLDGHGGALRWQTDRLGFINNGDVWGDMLMAGAGVRIAGKNEHDLPFLTFVSQRNLSAMDAIFDFVEADFTHFGFADYLGLSYAEGSERMFEEGRSLFMNTRLRIVERLRGMDTDFGILPMPWYNEHQREWAHRPGVTTGQMLSVPRFHDYGALNRVGFMLEALASESRYTVIPVWSEIQLADKLLRDDESKAMLDIILNSVDYDSGSVFDWGSFYAGFINHITGNRQVSARTYVSYFESMSSSIEHDIRRTVDNFARLQ